MTYEDFKDLLRRRASDKVLHDKAFSITKNPKYDGYQCKLALNFFIKSLLVVLLRMKICQTSN